MKHSIELNITGELTPEQLREFADAVPEGHPIITDVTVIPKDRPWDSEMRYVTLRAEWGI